MPPRLAWCYGDAGAGGVLACVAEVTGSLQEKRWAEQLLRGATRSHPLAGTVASVSLCHGLAGLLHVHNRASQSLGSPALRSAALAWLDGLLAQRRGSRGIGGFTRFEERGPAGPGGRTAQGYGLLNGAAGVGLALLATVSAVPPAWDRALLLSVRDGGLARGRAPRRAPG
jgi:hypothetical protein